MIERVKIEAKKIVIPEGRLSFFKADAATWRTKKDGSLDKGTPEKPKKPLYRMTWLLDPSRVDIQKVIAEIKAESARQLDLFFGGRENWPKANPVTGMGKPIMCWGNGNDLPKVYDGYKDMFYIKCSDAERPILGNSTGGVTQLGDKEHPYGGAYARGRVALYVYNNESCGVNSNFSSVFFVRPGAGFGGGEARSAEDEYAAFGDAPKAVSQEVDPFG